MYRRSSRYAFRSARVRFATSFHAHPSLGLQHMEGGIKWAIHVTTKLPTFIDGRVALLGDSVRRLAPRLSSAVLSPHLLRPGARYGTSPRSRRRPMLRGEDDLGCRRVFVCSHESNLQDAFLLAQYLGHRGVRKENVHVALQVYDEIRRPFSQHIMELSTKSAQCHHLRIPELADLSVEDSASGKALSQEQLWEVGEMMERLRDWRDHTDIMEENKVSMRRLDEVLAHTPALFGTVRGHRARL